MAIEAIIFDMDGVLIDSGFAWEQARSQLATETGCQWNREDDKKVMGVSSGEWADYMISRMGLKLSREAVINSVVKHLVGFYRQGIPFLPSAVETVHWAAARYPVALASGSHRDLLDIVVHAPELEGCFKVVVSADEVGVGKPDPAIYLEASRRLGISPEKCLCIEDSPFGVLSGRRANMYVINIPNDEYPLSPAQASNADLVLHSLSEFNEETIARLVVNPPGAGKQLTNSLTKI